MGGGGCESLGLFFCQVGSGDGGGYEEVVELMRGGLTQWLREKRLQKKRVRCYPKMSSSESKNYGLPILI